MLLRSLNDDALVGALAALHHCVEVTSEAETRRDAHNWFLSDVDDVRARMIERGIESDTVTALEI